MTDLPKWLASELCSDHAGETGAIYIYLGILSITPFQDLRAFAKRHLAAERKHLRLITSVLDQKDMSWLLPVWRVGGFFTGMLPAFFGRKAVFHTVVAVETFVAQHYGRQITRLRQEHGTLSNGFDIITNLEECMRDEISHKNEAFENLRTPAGWILKSWVTLVGLGSECAVNIVRHEFKYFPLIVNTAKDAVLESLRLFIRQKP